ncbi:MAG: C10 family peptidase [Prevotella sp.]|nr:C10 family peptidase [Prevotella sp.]
MKRILFLLLALIGTTTLLTARERTKNELISVAQQTMNRRMPARMKARRAMGQPTQPTVLQRYNEVSIVGYTDGGYVVVTNDDRFTPVMGYSDSAFDSNETANPGFHWWLRAMNASLQQMAERNENPVSIKPMPLYSSSVDELLTTSWGQEAPFNSQTPEYTENNQQFHYITGCVATSMAQVMNYHEYPTTGKGSKSYYFTPEEGGGRIRANANFGKTTYDYANMIDQYTYADRNKTVPNFTNEQEKAVSTLMYHCGVSVKMAYTKTGSGAYSADACRALREHFLFDENIKLFTRDYYPVDEWMQIIYGELNDRCPILYDGVDSQGGHSFVIDGYDDKGKVHVNWGWSGRNNGFYDIAALRGYNSGQDMIIVRRPDDARFNGTNYSIWGISEDGLTATSSVNTITVDCVMYNFDVDNFTGVYAVLAENLATGEITELYVSDQLQSIEYLNGRRIGISNINAEGLADGTYRVYVGTKKTDEATWRAVRSHEDVNNSYILTRTSGQPLTLKAENNSNWTAIPTGITAPPTVPHVAVSQQRSRSVFFDLQGRKLPANSHTRGLIIYHDGQKTIKTITR